MCFGCWVYINILISMQVHAIVPLFLNFHKGSDFVSFFYEYDFLLKN